jgi:hypothetical protein
MNHFQLKNFLDLNLKSDEMIEMIEHFDLTVVYDFDRLHEGIEDIYWVPAKKQGFELRFDQNQVLNTIFAYICPRNDFSPVDSSIIGEPLYRAEIEARNAFEQAGIAISEGQPSHRWIKGTFQDYEAHYEYQKSGELSLLTLMSTRK